MSIDNCIQSNTGFTFPKFKEPIVNLTFRNSHSFFQWYNEVPKKYFKVIETSQSVSPFNIPINTITKIATCQYNCQYHGKQKPGQKTNDRINCGAKLFRRDMSNGTVLVEYHWKHTNHSIEDIVELVTSVLPNDIQDWLEEYVQIHINWKIIKNVLYLIKYDPLEVNFFFVHIFYKRGRGKPPKVSSHSLKTTIIHFLSLFMITTKKLK